jgi:hypothetical protein
MYMILQEGQNKSTVDSLAFFVDCGTLHLILIFNTPAPIKLLSSSFRRACFILENILYVW